MLFLIENHSLLLSANTLSHIRESTHFTNSVTVCLIFCKDTNNFGNSIHFHHWVKREIYSYGADSIFSSETYTKHLAGQSKRRTRHASFLKSRIHISLWKLAIIIFLLVYFRLSKRLHR